MNYSTLTAISPVDGRYAKKTDKLRMLVSEAGLIKNRLIVEIRWLQCLAREPGIIELPAFSPATNQLFDRIIEQFDVNAAEQVKAIEQTTNHDVKAVEYFLKNQLVDYPELNHASEFIHFACTSEDINNLSYGLMIKSVREEVLLPDLQTLLTELTTLAQNSKAIPMLARTHGQAASPTTVGKELANFVDRLSKQVHQLQRAAITGKCNGAVGNYNAHRIAYPELDWDSISAQFVTSLGLQHNRYTTQIEPHDSVAEFLNILMLINSIFIDLARDCWGYISLDYFQQKLKANEVGSSTMPHKVNPIDFENAEGNFGIANALMRFLTMQLPVSRWQRDLVDSTVLRNLGVIFAHTVIGFQSLLQGLRKLTINEAAVRHDLNQHWEVITEAVQTVMRRYACENPYERLKELSRGKKLDQQSLHAFIETLEIPDIAKQQLKKLTPADYIGDAIILVDSLANENR